MAKTKATWGGGGPPYEVDIYHMSYGDRRIRLGSEIEGIISYSRCADLTAKSLLCLSVSLLIHTNEVAD
jgi:hypothetical protein